MATFRKKDRQESTIVLNMILEYTNTIVYDIPLIDIATMGFGCFYLIPLIDRYTHSVRCNLYILK